MNILAFAASNNRQSINRTLALYAAHLIGGARVLSLNIHDYEMPIFSDDRERELGQPEQAKAFFRKIGEADAIIVSYAEHNGGYTAAFKNLLDWTSRISREVFQHKPVVYLSTSPGAGGAANVLASATQSASYFGADLKASVSVPSFHDSFDIEANSVTSVAIGEKIQQAMRLLANSSQAGLKLRGR